MKWQLNTYYSFKEAPPSTIAIVESLLNAYPVTRACLDALGKKLLDQVQFAFFDSDQEFITQGEQGKDLFLLCNNEVNVLVNNQVIVQMNGPALLGDKAVIEPQSTRAASIVPSGSDQSLVIKIPLGLFIRSFKDSSVSDESFSQESSIYIQLFDVVQNRLFEYVFLQKQLWEQTSAMLRLLNIQLTAKLIDNQKDPRWPREVWMKLKGILASELKIAWPPRMPLNIEYLRKGLMSFLTVKFPRASFKGTESDYRLQKSQLWRNWLTIIAQAIVQELKDDELPLSLGEIELFNPKNYRLKIRALLKNIEAKTTPKELINATESEIEKWRETVPDIGTYFGSGEHTNAFKLKPYLNNYIQQYSLLYPNRTKAQLAQKISLIAATNENQFNTSVVKMQQFLAKVKTMVQDISISDESSKNEQKPAKVSSMINRIVNHVNSYISLKSGEFVETLGVVRYVNDFTPNLINLIKTTGSSQIRNELNHSVTSLGKMIGFIEPFEDHVLQNNIHMACGANQDSIPFNELNDHLWINLDSNIKLFHENRPILTLPEFSFIGALGHITDYNEAKLDIHLTVDVEIQEGVAPVNSLFFIIPAVKLPWTRNQLPDDKDFYHTYLPLYNLFINKQLELLSHLVVQRDLGYSELQQSFHAIQLERKVKQFEQNEHELRPPQKILINKMLRKLLGMKINPKATITGKKLSKVIYNNILKKIKEDSPGFSVEERGNKTYTKWRYVLTEVVLELEQIDPTKSSDNESPAPVFEQLEIDCGQILKKHSIESKSSRLGITSAKPALLLNQIFDIDSTSGIEANKAASEIMQLMGSNVIKVIQETVGYLEQSEEIKNQGKSTTGNNLQAKVIEDSIEELLGYLEQ